MTLEFVRLICNTCDDWKVCVSEKSLDLTQVTHRVLFHDGARIAYTVEPMSEDEEL